MIEPVSNKFYSNSGNMNVINSISESAVYILDIGCGAGDNARILKDKGKIVDGITLSESEAKEARKYCREVIVYDLDNGLPPGLDEKYDSVICSHVLEHLRFPQRVLSDIKLKLKEDSRLIVALPNIMVYRYRFKLLIGRFDYEEGGVMDDTHLRWYTFETGKKLLEENGLYIEKAWVEGGIPFGRFTRFLNTRIQKRIKKILYGISPGFFGGELLYISKLRNSES